MSSEHLDPSSGARQQDKTEPIELPQFQNYEPVNLTREDANHTRDAKEYNIMDGEEKRSANGIPQPEGFWHPSMGNVRSHVLKLWFKTGTGAVLP